MKIVFSSNIAWSIFNFRLPLLKSLQADGHKIYAVSASDKKYTEKLKTEGFLFEKVNINNNSTNPLKDILLLYQYYRVYKKIKPDVICHNAIKPNIYGTIAAKILGIPVVNNISGLGTLFIKKSFSTSIAKILYKISQRRAEKVFFQNKDDFIDFKKNNLVKEENCEIIPGSGVDTRIFLPNNDLTNKTFKFIFIGRLILDKGIKEFAEAIKILKNENYEFEADVLGPFYKSNSTSINKKQLEEWEDNKLIRYLGETDYVLQFMQKADCLVLPSYREGLSKVLIEGSSVGLPIITTDVPGCRDVISNNITGFLCEAKNSLDLAEKMKKMLNLSFSERQNMGLKSRERAIKYFDQSIIIKQYKDAIYSVT